MRLWLLLFLLMLLTAWAPAQEFVPVPGSVQRTTDGVTGMPVDVRVSGFLMGREELSQREFQRTMGRNPSKRKQPDHPVTDVSWREALQYCNRRSVREGLGVCYDGDGGLLRNCQGYRLPTEAEWLAAAGAEDALAAEELDAAHLYRGQNVDGAIAEAAALGTLPVGSGPVSSGGLRHAWGNVWEWCGDRFHAARIVDAVTDPQGPLTGNERVIRGGGYLTPVNAWNKGFRSSLPPDARSPYVGFRIARSLPADGRDAAPEAVPGIVKVEAAPAEPLQPAQELRRQWMQVLGAPQVPPIAVQAVVREQLVQAAWHGRLLDLTLEPGLPLRALLMLPASAMGGNPRERGRLPVVVIPFYDVDTPAGMDLGGRNAMPAGARAFGHLAVQHGLAALLVRWAGENDGPGYLEVVADLAQRHPGVSGLGYWVWQSQRIADWLRTQPEVDPARMAIAGHSLGGKMALYAAAFEPRYRAVVSSEPGIALSFSNYQDPWYLGERIGLLSPGADHDQLLQLTAPRPFLLIAGESADGAKSLPLLQRGARAYGAGTGLRTTPQGGISMLNHRSGHSPTPECVTAAMLWLRLQLRDGTGR